MRRFNELTSGGNPFSEFSPNTTNNDLNRSSGMNNFNNAFRINSPFVEKQDFRNKNNMLHNNVNENLMVEQVIEYTLNIDSADRSHTAYPNPFNFVVTFGGHGRTVDRQRFVRKNFTVNGQQNYNKQEIRNVEYEETPGPIIDRKFKNVKYLRIDYLILPKTNIVIESDISGCSGSGEDACISTDDSDYLAKKYKYLLLRIKEISTDNILGTNKNIQNDTFILYPDKIMGKSHIMWLPTTGNRNYKNSTLENLNRLTFEILDPNGELLYIMSSTGDEININKVSNECLLECINDNIQCNISLLLGVVENEMNTNTKFSY
jgi:hypothetical protein